mmetsp:Transcript_4808/g.6954  ORF Transcript_4808/g.6954 Transcript_4808/m.6954 type:complete len:136 (-) Transcript_4808:45-452(-)
MVPPLPTENLALQRIPERLEGLESVVGGYKDRDGDQPVLPLDRVGADDRIRKLARVEVGQGRVVHRVHEHVLDQLPVFGNVLPALHNVPRGVSEPVPVRAVGEGGDDGGKGGELHFWAGNCVSSEQVYRFRCFNV